MNTKITLLVFMLIAVINIKAQVPNGDFENWTTFSGYETPSGIWTCFNSSSDGSFYSVSKSNDSHTGSYSLKISNSYPCNLSTEPYKFGAIFTTPKGTYSLPLTQTTMFAPSIERSGHPTGLTGYYKYSQGGSGNDLDTMRILVSLYKSGQEVYSNEFKNSATVSNWTQFTVNFPTYLDTEVDSFGIVINACQPWDGVKGNSSLLVDDLTFNSSSTGINKIEKSNSACTIFPNPVTNYFQINGLVSLVNVSIVDLSGKLLFTKEVMINEKINISSLKNGIYLMEIKTPEGIQSIKLIKE